MTDVVVWENDTLTDFTKKDYVARHNLHENPLFNEDGLIKIIDNYPKESLEVFTMGKDPYSWGKWFLGRHDNLSGRELMQAVKNGRIWLNLRKCNLNNPEVDAVCKELFREIEEHTGVGTFKHDMGLLISSPGAQVFYHADMPLVLLLQISGVKRVYLYPPSEPYINEKQLEAIAIKEKDEQLKVQPEWDNDAFVHDLKPGEFLTWRQNAPHRIVNQDGVNVSFSIEFQCAESVWKSNLYYANGCLRRFFGFNPSVKNSPKVVEIAKIIYARVVKLMGGYKSKNTLPKPRFTLDGENLGQLKFDKDFDPSVLN